MKQADVHYGGTQYTILYKEGDPIEVVDVYDNEGTKYPVLVMQIQDMFDNLAFQQHEHRSYRSDWTCDG